MVVVVVIKMDWGWVGRGIIEGRHERVCAEFGRWDMTCTRMYTHSRTYIHTNSSDPNPNSYPYSESNPNPNLNPNPDS